MRSIALLLAAMIPAFVSAAECTARSGPNTTTALVELYTSEGCDSCPPADRWVSKLAASGFDSSRVVALAFHVDYWDYIGWKDPFAKPAWTQRQRDGVRSSGGRIVYTPQVTLNGKDFRPWSLGGAFRDAVTAINARPPSAALELVARVGEREITVSTSAQLRNSANPQEHALFLALTESRLVSAVKAGENTGKTLNHDHVVRELRRSGLFDASGRNNTDQVLAITPGWNRDALGLVAFVQNTLTGEILQALALPLCRG